MCSKELKFNNKKSFQENINQNFKIFQKKKKLREAYFKIYKIISKYIKPDQTNLEIGSGFGYLKRFSPNLITSDFPKNEFVDKEVNAYFIKNETNYYDNIILIDVFHHLEFPKKALNQFHSVLKKNGHLIIADVHLGLIPKLIFKLFHHEPVNFETKISLLDKKFEINDYFSNQSYYQRIILEDEEKIRSEYFNLKQTYNWSDFRYIFTGGFSNKQYLPNIVLSIVHLLDEKIFSFFPKIFSVRGIAILTKK